MVLEMYIFRVGAGAVWMMGGDACVAPAQVQYCRVIPIPKRVERRLRRPGPGTVLSRHPYPQTRRKAFASPRPRYSTVASSLSPNA
jgi:hypothetical protein